ncbi:MAG TPA: MFS transporter [Chloroflexota bacterium]|nr:MFS transporter [Chloroflexota bacterium]
MADAARSEARATAAAAAGAAGAAERAPPNGASGKGAIPGAQGGGGRFGALHHRGFALLWVGLLVSNTGTWMQGTAQSYLVYQLTSSPLALGALGLAFALPMLFLPPLGGVVADRIDRLALMRLTNVLWMGLTLVLAVLTWTGAVTYWQILLASFLSAVLLAFDNPTRQALVPDLVPREDILSAISLNAVVFTGASLVGPALAGLILGAYATRLEQGAAIVFGLNAVSYLAVLLPLLWWIRVPPRRREGPPASIGADLVEGLRYVKHRRPLVLLLLLTAVTSVFGRSFSQLMPVFAQDVLAVGPRGLGLMYSAPGAGTLLGGTVLAAIGQVGRPRRLVAGATAAFTLTIFGFALSASFPLSLLLLFLGGVASTVAGATIATLLQGQAPGRLRGRVMSLQTLAIIGMGPLGALISGALATRLPAPLAISLSAAVVLLFLLAVVLTQPAWAEVDAPPPAPAAAPVGSPVGSPAGPPAGGGAGREGETPVATRKE